MKNCLSRWALVLCVCVNITYGAPAAESLTVPAFIDKMVTIHQYNRRELVQLFQQTEYLPEVIDRINKPFEEKPWDFYKHFFINSDRIAGGVQYWHEHADTLQKVSQQYGVDPAVIVAIIGVESNYGQQPMKFPTLRTLATLSFHYPKRAVFFQHELENYLLLTREHQLPPLSLYGSYAGALGIPQFMPSNYRQYAVSYEGKPSVNLLTNHEDAIASIGHYLQNSGWQMHQPVAFPAKIKGSVKPWLISTNAKPIYSLKTLKKFGINSSSATSLSHRSALIAMHNTHDKEYWVTFQNFYAIMSYNPRTTYAMAIYQLSEEIKKTYGQGTPPQGATISSNR